MSPVSLCSCNAAWRASWRSMTLNHSDGEQPNNRAGFAHPHTPKNEDGKSIHQRKCPHWQDQPHDMLSCDTGTRLTRWISTDGCWWQPARLMHQTNAGKNAGSGLTKATGSCMTMQKFVGLCQVEYQGRICVETPHPGAGSMTLTKDASSWHGPL